MASLLAYALMGLSGLGGGAALILSLAEGGAGFPCPKCKKTMMPDWNQCLFCGCNPDLEMGKPGILHGSRSYLLQDKDGQIKIAHSISAGLDYQGVGPEHSYYKKIGRAQYVSVTDSEALEGFKKGRYRVLVATDIAARGIDVKGIALVVNYDLPDNPDDYQSRRDVVNSDMEALEGFKILCEMEGIIPALEPSHAIYYAVKKLAPKLGKNNIVAICLSGRGDKDIDIVKGLRLKV